MSITTINTRPIAHKRNLDAEQKMFDATAQEMEELCPVETIAESLVNTLQMMNPDVREIIADKDVAIIEIGLTITEVRIAGFTFADLYTSMLAAVIQGGRG